jgi:hypothetical protein
VSFLGNSFGAGPNNNQQTANNQLNATAQTGLNFGNSFLSGAQGAFQAPTSYYQSILSGNPASVSQAIAPSVNQLNSAYTQASQQNDQFAPMGGGRAAMQAQLPYQKAGAITNLISGAQQGAAQGLTGIGSAEGSIGNTALGIGGNAANAFDVNAGNQHDFQYNANNAIGGAIGKMIAPLIFA